MVRNFVLFVLLLLLLGCAGKVVTVWDKEGVSDEQMQLDLAQCEYEAKQHNLESTLSEQAALEREHELRDMCLKAKGYKMVSREYVPGN